MHFIVLSHFVVLFYATGEYYLYCPIFSSDPCTTIVIEMRFDEFCNGCRTIYISAPTVATDLADMLFPVG